MICRSRQRALLAENPHGLRDHVLVAVSCAGNDDVRGLSYSAAFSVPHRVRTLESRRMNVRWIAYFSPVLWGERLCRHHSIHSRWVGWHGRRGN